MKILAVDTDRKALDQLESSLKSVFIEAEVITFTKALESYQYFLRHPPDIELIYFPLVIKPFDAFKYCELIRKTSFSGNVIFITENDNREICELIRLNGGNRYIAKPVTLEKIRDLAILMQELCLDLYDEAYSDDCSGCIYHWCEKQCQHIKDAVAT